MINNQILFVIYKENKLYHYNVESISEFSCDVNCQLMWNEYKEITKWFIVSKKSIKKNDTLTFTKIDDKYEKKLKD